jgi:Flp pilus assembly protein TadD
MEKANKAMRKQRRDDEVEHLRNALRIDPEYVAARNNLGVCLLKDDPASAIAQLEKAIDIDPHEAALFHNLAIGYMITYKLDDAERAARSAIDLDRTNTRMRTLLGIILVLERKYTAEALADLEPATKEYPVAGLYAAQVLIKQQELSKARLYVNGYLSSGDQRYRDFAERWLHYIDRSLATSAAALPSPSVPAQQ